MGIRLGSLITSVAVLCIAIYLFVSYFPEPEDSTVPTEDLAISGVETKQRKKEITQLVKGDLFSFFGAKSEEIEKEFGKPVRKDKSPYGYESLIYTDGKNEYIHFGIHEDKVVMIFTTGEKMKGDPFLFGSTYDDLHSQFSFTNKVTYERDQSFYSFLVDEDQRRMNPLVQINHNLFVQLYFDTFTNTLSSIRIISGDLLIRQRFYEMEYIGDLPQEKELSKKDWEEISMAMEQQILLLTNVYRSHHDVPALLLDEQVSKVARLHSKDMYENNYFSHNSPDGTDLKNRLKDGDIYYLAAGENIAAQYTDAPSVVEGWLNSEGHRESLLEETFTHIGIGVYRFYFTQNFVTRQ